MVKYFFLILVLFLGGCKTCIKSHTETRIIPARTDNKCVAYYKGGGCRYSVPVPVPESRKTVTVCDAYGD